MSLSVGVVRGVHDKGSKGKTSYYAYVKACTARKRRRLWKLKGEEAATKVQNGYAD